MIQGGFFSGLTFFCGFSYDSSRTRLAAPFHAGSLGFVPGLGSIDGGRSKPSDLMLSQLTSCNRILGSSAPNFFAVPSPFWHFEPPGVDTTT